MYDSDPGSDDLLSNRYEVQLGSPGHSALGCNTTVILDTFTLTIHIFRN